ncbi:LPS assembly lipoprotein LptE [Halomonas daqiaonensis]|uniref:LPS-assembly lipoprotein LptE n=1 Tax=Halomonas daqiaonensis TaxID=650850 RepID=A0A1H7HDL6_9GAMM|nr:LPS assembly lipoprotein LptE [Halomonas daqiaonensis]SEK48298.1 LPS-assembly lipoprotein [Halomonas daqiaonensis]
MQRRSLLQFGLTAGASLALAGCGFRLRGFDQPVVAIDALAVEGADSELARRVTRRLESAGTRVHDQAALVLNLGTENFRERRLSVLDSGHRDLEMTLAVPFSVQRRADGAYLLDQQRLEVSEHLTVNDDQLLAQDDLREETRDRLRDDAVSQLMNRLRALDTE